MERKMEATIEGLGLRVLIMFVKSKVYWDN